jgi:hypothetical protein
MRAARERGARAQSILKAHAALGAYNSHAEFVANQSRMTVRQTLLLPGDIFCIA